MRDVTDITYLYVVLNADVFRISYTYIVHVHVQLRICVWRVNL